MVNAGQLNRFYLDGLRLTAKKKQIPPRCYGMTKETDVALVFCHPEGICFSAHAFDKEN